MRAEILGVHGASWPTHSWDYIINFEDCNADLARSKQAGMRGTLTNYLDKLRVCSFCGVRFGCDASQRAEQTAVESVRDTNAKKILS